MKKIIILIFLVLYFSSCQEIKNYKKQINIDKKSSIKTQEKKLKDIIILDKKLKESSGLLVLNGELWTINDSGGKNEIYKIDKKTGKILQIKKIINAKNIDWESLAQGEKYIFIGDIGNNKGQRKKLQIYKINKKDFFKKDNLKAEKIEFSYKDFSVNKKFQNKNLEKINFSKFDAESLIFFKGNLYIFSKGWKDYKIKIYKIDPNKKFQIIKKISEKNLRTLITGAFNYKNKIFLVGYEDIFVSNPSFIILKNFKNDDFFSGEISKKNIFDKFYSSQIESIGIDNKNIFFTSEKEKYAIIKNQSLIILEK